MYLDNPTLNALLLFAIAFGSFVSASIIHRDAANVGQQHRIESGKHDQGDLQTAIRRLTCFIQR